MSQTAKSPKDRAVEKAGGQSNLARELGVTRSAISQWDQIPLNRVFDVERVTGIPHAELRPDFFGESEGAA